MRGIEVRRASPEDAAEIARIGWRSGVSVKGAGNDLSGSPGSSSDHFLVAEERGELLATVGYRKACGGLVLNPVAVDPVVEEARFVPELYSGAGELARHAGIPLVWVENDVHREYLLEAGYVRRVGGWRLDTEPLYVGPRILPERCRRWLAAYWRVTDAPPFRAFWF